MKKLFILLVLVLSSTIVLGQSNYKAAPVINPNGKELPYEGSWVEYFGEIPAYQLVDSLIYFDGKRVRFFPDGNFNMYNKLFNEFLDMRHYFFYENELLYVISYESLNKEIHNSNSYNIVRERKVYLYVRDKEGKWSIASNVIRVDTRERKARKSKNPNYMHDVITSSDQYYPLKDGMFDEKHNRYVKSLGDGKFEIKLISYKVYGIHVINTQYYATTYVFTPKGDGTYNFEVKQPETPISRDTRVTEW